MTAYMSFAAFGPGGLTAFFSPTCFIWLTAVFAGVGVAAFLAGGTMSSGEREELPVPAREIFAEIAKAEPVETYLLAERLGRAPAGGSWNPERLTA